MRIEENLKISVSNLWVNKLRSVLTLLGIIIGVASVILMISIGEGARMSVTGQIESLGVNMIWIQPDWHKREVQMGDFKNLSIDDVTLIQRAVPSLAAVAPDIIKSYPVKYQGNEETAGINGTNAAYITVRSMNVAEGRFINDVDVRASRRVVVLSGDLADKIFNTRSALGEKVKINGQQFQVIGVMSKVKGSFAMDSTTSGLTGYIPYTTMMEMTGQPDVHVIFAQASRAENVSLAMEQIETLLQRKYASKYVYMVQSLEQQMQVFGQVTQVFTMVLAAIGSISLIVGGIGVMNIMLVSVTERTREIGIRMAIGARRREILSQFLWEAILLCFIGGTMGIALGTLGAMALANIALWKPVVSMTSILLAFGFSTLIGVVFGVYPAYKASRLDPIEALRYE